MIINGDYMKNKETFKRNIYAFLIPILILILSLGINKFYPFGNKLLTMLDGFNQYPGFLNSFIESLKNHQSFFYSFKGLLGFNIFANYAYYSLNITNLLFLFFKSSNIINFYTFSIILKIGLCSLTMNIFLEYLKKSKSNLYFSICYGLSIYNLTYYLNYMWFDSIILLPLVILGIEKIFKENKCLIYFISLALAIISNFYIGYMICIFSVLYFIYKSITDKFSKNILKKYIISSLLAGFIGAIFLLPAIFELINGKGTLFASYTEKYFKFDLDFINVFYKLTFASFSNGDLEYGNPNIYVSIFIYVNLIMYFFNKNIKLKERITSLCLFLFFLLSMSFNLLDFFWQMMQMPVWYPVRYGFIFDFYIILLAYKNFQNYSKFKPLTLTIICLIILALSITGFFTSGNLNEPENLTAKYIYLGISLLFIIYYAIILNSESFKKYVIVILIIELSLSTYVAFRNNGNEITKSEFSYSYNLNKDVIESINLNPFERLTFDESTIKNNGLLLNYNDINLFSSVRNKNTIDILEKLFNTSVLDDCNVNYFYNNPITNALLNIKYYTSKSDMDYYEKINTINDYKIYQNNDVSSIGFITNNDITKLKLTDDYINNINELVKVINHSEDNIIKEIPIKYTTVSCSNICIINGSPEFNYEYTSDNKYFLFVHKNKTSNDKSNYQITINDKTFTDYKVPYLIDNKDHVTIKITTKTSESNNYKYHAYLVSYDEYQKLIQNINKNKINNINYISDSNFTFNIDTQNDGLLFTTIAADDGWKVYVDNEKFDFIKIYDGLIGINLHKGTHQIKFTYTPKGFKEGAFVSAISLLISIVYLKKEKNN